MFFEVISAEPQFYREVPELLVVLESCEVYMVRKYGVLYYFLLSI